MTSPRPRLALVLSGGGARATAFHLGVLLRLAKEQRLEDVVRISTVSGGSLAIGLVFSRTKMRWPASAEYVEDTLPAIKEVLTRRSLQGRALVSTLCKPWNLFRSRGNLFAAALRASWGIDGTIKQLPQRLMWYINATSYESGRSWRFSPSHIGDYVLGHNYTQDVPLSTAMAASAAIPYLAGFVKVPLDIDGWHKIDPMTEQPVRAICRPCRAVRLWDGGVYENLGIEAIWKPDEYAHDDIDFMIVSDASAKLPLDLSRATGVITTKAPFFRPPRLFDIATEQTRALRLRMIMSAIRGQRCNGAVVRLGNSVEKIDKDAGRVRNDLQGREFLEASAVTAAAGHPTNANRFAVNTFELLLRHGFENADATLTGHVADKFPEPFMWKS